MIEILAKLTIGATSLLILSYTLIHFAGFALIPITVAWLAWMVFK